MVVDRLGADSTGASAPSQPPSCARRPAAPGSGVSLPYSNRVASFSASYLRARAAPTRAVVDAALEVVVALREASTAGPVAARPARRGSSAATFSPVQRIEQVVRVAERVDVAHRAVDRPGRHLERRDRHRGVEVAGIARQTCAGCARSAAAPARSRPRARGRSETKRSACVQRLDEARLGLDEVRVLGRLGEHRDVHLVAADRRAPGCRDPAWWRQTATARSARRPSRGEAKRA